MISRPKIQKITNKPYTFHSILTNLQIQISHVHARYSVINNRFRAIIREEILHHMIPHETITFVICFPNHLSIFLQNEHIAFFQITIDHHLTRVCIQQKMKIRFLIPPLPLPFAAGDSLNAGTGSGNEVARAIFRNSHAQKACKNPSNNILRRIKRHQQIKRKTVPNLKVLTRFF